MDLLCESDSFQIASPVVDATTEVVFTLCRSTGSILALLPSSTTSTTSKTSLEVVPLVHLDSQPESIALDILTAVDEEAGVLVRFLVADASAQAVRKIEVSNGGGHMSLQDVLADASQSKRGLVVGASASVGAAVATSSTLISTFEGVPLVGPNAVAIVPGGVAGPELLIADGGAVGETSLCDPRGCVYTTLNGRRQLVRVVGPGLAMPCGVANWGTGSGTVTYITEMCTNRVLRVVKPEEHGGAVHTSVFVQLSGGMGPVAVVADPQNGDVFIATYDVEFPSTKPTTSNAGSGGEEEEANTGSVHVYDHRGELKGTIVVPSPRITGLAFDTTSATATALFITTLTQKSSQGGSWSSQLYRTQISGGEEEDQAEE